MGVSVRFRIDVAADDAEMPWADVHGAARGVVYDLLRSQDAQLATQLHDVGWQGSPLRPVGISPPVFFGVKRRTAAYAMSGQGSVWLGSPEPRIAGCLLAGVAGRREIRWGGTVLRVKGVALDPVRDHSSGESILVTGSPVLVKHDDRYLLPDDALYEKRLVHNLRHKADLLGLPNDVELEVLDAGPRRLFYVEKAPRVGATVRVRVRAAPVLLDALVDWGLGLCTTQGFGWVR